ncbi:ribonuclease H-like domain-containing protein, partial [Mycena vulgaris]
VIGFNISGFDLPYLLARANALHVADFPLLGRLKGSSRISVPRFDANRHARSWQDIPLAGRLQLDLMQYVRCEQNPPQLSLSLNAVAKRFLGEKKEDVHFTAIAGLQAGSPETRRELAVYCLKDAYLPQRLLEVLGCVDRYTAISHERQTPFNSIVPDHDSRASNKYIELM